MSITHRVTLDTVTERVQLHLNPLIREPLGPGKECSLVTWDFTNLSFTSFRLRRLILRRSSVPALGRRLLVIWKGEWRLEVTKDVVQRRCHSRRVPGLELLAWGQAYRVLLSEEDSVRKDVEDLLVVELLLLLVTLVHSHAI